MSDHWSRGGKARAAALSPERRTEISREAAKVRWSGDRPPPYPKRPHMPLAVKLAAALRLAGLDPAEAIEWDHDPPLGLRERTPEGGYIPDANDDRYIVPRQKKEHREKTNGTGATVADGDIHKIAKAKRLAKDSEAFRARVLAREPGQPRQRKGTIQSRGFKRKGHQKC
jgi:hypothetical protein